MKPRGRPKKYRLVENIPKILKFSPRGKAGRPDEITITIDEFEALRLADAMGRKQEEAARVMNISQETFSRILKKARRQLADAFVHGKIVKIDGGEYILG